MFNIKEMTEADLYEDFMDLCKEAGFQPSSDLLDYLATQSNDGARGFFVAPASTKYHGDYSGGLYEHSRMVYAWLKQLTKNNDLRWQRRESPFIIGMFHDLCKCDQYIRVDGIETQVGDSTLKLNTGYHYEYNKNTLLKGHGSKSVMILSRFTTLTEEEMLCIRYHMGAYEKEEWAEFDMAIHKYQNVFWTHAADMLASKVSGV